MSFASPMSKRAQRTDQTIKAAFDPGSSLENIWPGRRLPRKLDKRTHGGSRFAALHANKFLAGGVPRNTSYPPNQAQYRRLKSINTLRAHPDQFRENVSCFRSSKSLFAPAKGYECDFRGGEGFQNRSIRSRRSSVNWASDSVAAAELSMARPSLRKLLRGAEGETPRRTSSFAQSKASADFFKVTSVEEKPLLAEDAKQVRFATIDRRSHQKDCAASCR